MGLQQINEDLPELYKSILPSFFDNSIPIESFSTCGDCAMVCKDSSKAEELAQRPFLPDRKCCTFHPVIPNYLIGALLSDRDPNLDEGRRRIREKIKNRTGVSPAGITSPNHYTVLYKSGREHGFGVSKSLICPYFIGETGFCSIWKYREAICSTFFCKSISGNSGKLFWENLKNYLLMTHANQELNIR